MSEKAIPKLKLWDCIQEIIWYIWKSVKKIDLDHNRIMETSDNIYKVSRDLIQINTFIWQDFMVKCKGNMSLEEFLPF